MDIGAYTFEEFKRLAANFHGYAAPGVLIGGFMMEKAKAALPQGTLFEAVVETPKCLPDAVQLLSVCSTGNQRLKIHNLGRYALSLFDKYTGEGWRVSLDTEKMKAYPELYQWFFKLKPKKEQDSQKLEDEIREAGDSICALEPVRVKPRFIGVRKMGSFVPCPICGEGYPAQDGPVCRGCQGEAPYQTLAVDVCPAGQPAKVVPVEEAVGKIAAHDMTRIEPGQFKGPEFRAGNRIEAGDVCRLQRMGRFNVAVIDGEDVQSGMIHENAAAEAFALVMAGDGIEYSLPPKEGKIEFRAARDGLLVVDSELLRQFNLAPQVMAACRHDGTVVKKGSPIAGCRAIPLYLPEADFKLALKILGNGPLFSVLPQRMPKAGILVTGTEVFNGLIEDKFIPIITSKILAAGGEVLKSIIVPDDRSMMLAALAEMREAGIDLLVTTGGLSVDPDDVTRQALLDAGLYDMVYGMPVLPGAMSMVGKLPGKNGEIQVAGVPACGLYYKTTFFDLVLPRLLAGQNFTRQDAAKMGEGGFCLSCKVCSWPKCAFGK